MSVDELKPFLKVGVVVFALALFGFIAMCSLGTSGTALDDCNALKMDNINPCRERMRACTGDEATAKACQQKVLRDLK